MTSVGEGVETEQQLDRLRAEGCVEAQGFLSPSARFEGDRLGTLQALVPGIRTITSPGGSSPGVAATPCASCCLLP